MTSSASRARTNGPRVGRKNSALACYGCLVSYTPLAHRRGAIEPGSLTRTCSTSGFVPQSHQCSKSLHIQIQSERSARSHREHELLLDLLPMHLRPH